MPLWRWDWINVAAAAKLFPASFYLESDYRCSALITVINITIDLSFSRHAVAGNWALTPTQSFESQCGMRRMHSNHLSHVSDSEGGAYSRRKGRLAMMAESRQSGATDVVFHPVSHRATPHDAHLLRRCGRDTGLGVHWLQSAFGIMEIAIVGARGRRHPALCSGTCRVLEAVAISMTSPSSVLERLKMNYAISFNPSHDRRRGVESVLSPMRWHWWVCIDNAQHLSPLRQSQLRPHSHLVRVCKAACCMSAQIPGRSLTVLFHREPS
jgi:hypothetical protein